MKRSAAGGANGFQRRKTRKASLLSPGSKLKNKAASLGFRQKKLTKESVSPKTAEVGRKRKLESPSVRASGKDSAKKTASALNPETSGGKPKKKEVNGGQQKRGGILHQALVREGAEAEDDFIVGDVEDDGPVAMAVGENVEPVAKRKKQQKQQNAKLPEDVEDRGMAKGKKVGSGGESNPKSSSKKGEVKKGSKEGKVRAENREGKQKESEKKGKDVKEVKDSGSVASKGKKFVFVSPPEDESPAAMAAWFQTAFTGHFGAEISSLERAEITGDHVAQFPQQKPPRPLADLAGHLKRIVGPAWKHDLLEKDLSLPQGSREPGSPVVLIVASSAMRCVDILRSVSEFGQKCKPAKLFAKHFKVGEQVAMLQERVNIAAGTPDRLGKLAAMGALGLGELRFVVIDMLKNAKNCTLLDIPEIRTAFWDFYRAHLHERVVRGSLQLCFY